MSDATWQAVEDAMRIHMADENQGAYLTGWVATCVGASAKDSHTAHYQFMNHMGPAHEWMGLAEMTHQRALQYSLRRALGLINDDDPDEDD